MAPHPDDRRPEIRAGDDDREEAITLLRRHVSDGRLTMDEFEDRVALVWMARTFGDLDRITADLPVPVTAQQPARQRQSGPPVRHRPPPGDDSVRKVAATFTIIAVFLIVIWLLTGAGYFWPIWPILGFGLVIGLKSVNR